MNKPQGRKSPSGRFPSEEAFRSPLSYSTLFLYSYAEVKQKFTVATKPIPKMGRVNVARESVVAPGAPRFRVFRNVGFHGSPVPQVRASFALTWDSTEVSILGLC